MGWTPDQHKAIYTDTGSGNLLVSAAAGSGKTAVLVERVLQKILSGKSTVDRLLIVTFTEAAASEMRQKIIKRLVEYLRDTEDEKQKRLIKNQLSLAHTADIMTIDGFCNRVVLNNFHTLGIDPNIQICDDGMSKLLMQEALEAMYSRIYSSDDEVRARFKRLTDFYAKDRTNDPLSDLIISVYRFTEPFADPEKWLDDAVSYFDLPILEQPIMKYRFLASKSAAKRAISELGVENTQNTVYKTARAILDAQSWDEIYALYKTFFDKPKKREQFLKDSLVGGSSAEFAANILCDVFSPGKTIKTALGITSSSEEIQNTYKTASLKEEAADIAWIVGEFTNEYTKIKESRNLYEFSDIEHLTYRLFNENETIRNEYRDRYDEILIDEYQDTNTLQDNIFELISHNNIFMVGDLKQSIYRFRKGDPYIFKAKAQNYNSDKSHHNRIILSQNFRSRTEVLDSVNDIFSKIMSETAGDVDYMGGEFIVRDSEYEYYPPANNLKSELHYVAVGNKAEISRDLCEARYTAQKINELLNSGAEVYDKNTKSMRPIQKRDIVILASSLKYNKDILTDELSALGIDSYVDKSSFFDRREIDVMLSLISVINNSHNDIPLIAVLRSPIGGFSDNDLAIIRIHDKNAKYFIDAVSQYAAQGEDKRIAARCCEFVSNLKRWRDYVRKKSVAQLIWAIYEETYFYDMMGAIEEGEEAQTNLRLLYERAKQYENAGFKGLFNFIKYMEQIRDNSSDLEGAKLVGENHDVVRIMTIHKSKGLEFPYVFLIGAGRDFPMAQDFSLIKMHKSLGFGLPDICYEKHYARKTNNAELIKRINMNENISERMRLLYVAMTRPREKLYVIITRKSEPFVTKESLFKKWVSKLTDEKMLPCTALSAKGFYDWLCPAAAASPKTWEVYFNFIETTLDSDAPESKPQQKLYEDNSELKDTVYKILDYSYPYCESHTIPTRTSVTQLKELALQNNDDTVYEPDSRRTSGVDDIAELMFSPLHSKPKFLLDDTEKPANEIGTLYHLVMSKLDIDKIRKKGTDEIESELDRLIAEGNLTYKDSEYINPDKIKAFFKTPLAERMMNSEKVYREKPFQINISALDYDPSLSDMSKDETVILQGIIDCFFEEKDGFVLFDYKTDKVKNNATQIKERYQKQLDLYKRAIEELTKKPVKESYLYLFDTDEVI